MSKEEIRIIRCNNCNGVVQHFKGNFMESPYTPKDFKITEGKKYFTCSNLEFIDEAGIIIKSYGCLHFCSVDCATKFIFNNFIGVKEE